MADIIFPDAIPFAKETLSPSGSALAFTASVYGSSTGVSGNPGAKFAIISVDAADVRFWADGSVPTNADGLYVKAGQIVLLSGHEAIRNFKVINVSGTPKVSAQFLY